MSVCLSVSKITQKQVRGFRWHFACRQGHGRTDQLLSPAIRIIVRMPDPDCFLHSSIAYALQHGILLRRENPY